MCSEEKYRHMVEGITDVIYEVDRYAKITYVSPALRLLTGYDPSEITGRYFTDFVHPEDLPATLEAFRTAGASDRVSHETRILTKSGEIRWVRRSTSPILSDGRTVGYRGVLTDVTARRRAEEENTGELQRQYRYLLESLDATVWEINASDFRFTFVSRQCERLLGYSAERWLAELTWQDLVHPGDVDQVLATCGKAIEEGRNHDLEYRMIAADDRVVWISHVAARVAHRDGSAKVRGALVDITERKRAEEALQNVSEELESRVEDQVPRGDAYGMSLRQLQIVRLVAVGQSDKEIAMVLCLHRKTISKHLEHIRAKMGCVSRTEVAARAVREGLID